MLANLLASTILLQHDKVYAVLAVLLIIFGALMAYAWTTNRKVARLEAQLEALDQAKMPKSAKNP